MAEDADKIIKKYSEEIEEKFKRHTGVLLEKFEDQAKTLVEGIENVDGKLERFRKEVNIRFDGIERRLDSIA